MKTLQETQGSGGGDERTEKKMVQANLMKMIHWLQRWGPWGCVNKEMTKYMCKSRSRANPQWGGMGVLEGGGKKGINKYSGAQKTRRRQTGKE